MGKMERWGGKELENLAGTRDLKQEKLESPTDPCRPVWPKRR